MVRRPTVVLLIVFVVVLGAGFFLTKTSVGEKLMTTETPTPTVLPKLVSWPVDQAVKIDVKSSQNGEFLLQKAASGNWEIAGLIQPVDNGKVGEMVSALATLDNIGSMPASTTLDSVGLQSPAYTLVMTASSGDNETLQIGNATPTGTGYYVRLGQGDIVLVQKSSLDEVINLLSVEQLAVQPTGTAIPAGVATPSGGIPTPAQ